MGVYLPHTHGLPSTYQEVEYIESSGTQYINTGVKPTNKTKVINKGFLGNASVFYGVGRQSYYQSLSLLTDGTNYRGRCRSGSSSNSTVTSTIPWGTDVHIFEISQGDGFYIDGTKIGTFTSYTYTESYNIYVFGWSNRGTFIDGGIARLYYMEIYEDGTLIRNFIPCYRKSDSVIGLYDLVNNQFYTNSGTGTFTKGANVTAVPLKNAYIGEYKEITTETFRYSDRGTYLYKAGYKIKEVTIQYTAHTSSSGWLSQTLGLVIYNPNTSTEGQDYRAIFRLKSEWHYSGYVDAGYGMVGGWRKDDGTSGDTQIKRFASSATNSSGGSCILTFNEDGGRIRVGTTFGTRIQDETYTHDSAKKTRTQTIFNSQYVRISGNADATVTNDLITVTREPVS